MSLIVGCCWFASVPEQMKRGIYHLPIEEVIAGNTKHIQMKLRPYTMEFLAQASEFCQITIYTGIVLCLTFLFVIVLIL